MFLKQLITPLKTGNQFICVLFLKYGGSNIIYVVKNLKGMIHYQRLSKNGVYE